MTAIRRSYSGSAVATTLTADINATDTVIQVVATTNYPDTTIGPFVVTIGRGTPNEEKILVSSFTSTSLNVADGGRGYDGTTGIDHSVGDTLACTLDSQTINEANDYVMLNGTVTPSSSAVGDSAAKGTSAAAAAADHVHAREAWASGATTASAPGDSEDDGTSTSPARADHRHAREDVQFGVGMVGLWPSASDYPDNCLPMDGSSVSATTWPALASAHPSWVSNGNITLPDWRDKFIVGAGDSYTVGSTGGSNSVTIANANLPLWTPTISVTSTVDDPGHAHVATPGYNTAIEAESTIGTATPGDENVTFDEIATSKVTTGITVTSRATSTSLGQSSPTALTVTPPYYAAIWVVRAA